MNLKNKQNSDITFTKFLRTVLHIYNLATQLLTAIKTLQMAEKSWRQISPVLEVSARNLISMHIKRIFLY